MRFSTVGVLSREKRLFSNRLLVISGEYVEVELGDFVEQQH